MPKPSPEVKAKASQLMRVALSNPKPIADNDPRALWLPPGARTNRMHGSFNQTQRDDLSRLSVDAEQLKRLEVSLRIVRAYTQAPAALRDVRKPLSKLAKAAGSASTQLEAVLRAPNHEGALMEAQLRLMEAWCYTNPNAFGANNLEPFALLRTALTLLRESAERAVHDIPREQSRTRAHTYPIYYIANALLQGFCATQNARGLKRWPPYPFRPSSSPKSRFREIVGICYEAAGCEFADPERAIKAYLRAKRSAGTPA